MKRGFQKLLFFLFVSLAWGILICFFICPLLFMFFDWATNTQLMKLIDTYIIGSGYFALDMSYWNANCMGNNRDLEKEKTLD